MANESTITLPSLLPTYESLYGDEGKFPVDPDTVARLRAEAEEQGLIFSGDATAGEKLSEFIRNVPDAAYSFLARGAEGTAELAAGLALLTYKGGKLATETDPEKLKEIMAEPSFTKYLGEFRGALGNLNLGENRISGPRLEDMTGTIAYNVAPIPMLPVARGAGQIAKGLASTQVGKNIADELGTAVTYFPQYTPFRGAQPKSVGAMSVDELIESGQLKKASEITDDAENLMAIKRDRLQKLIEAKRPGGTIFEIGEEGTEGTFRYRGETYDKADGILIGYPSKRAGRDFEKNWVPKKVIEEPNVEAMKEGAKAGLEGKRLKSIDQYATLKDNMLKNNLTFEEAVVEAAGKELKRSTKNYQIVGKFYRIADEMKKVNPELHAFFENQVKAYQIGNEVGGKFKKVRFGTKEYEEARIKLAEKLNIDVKNIDRAHSIMQSRLTKLSKLVEDGTITSEQYNRLAKPQYFLLNADNLKHVGLENKLDELLQRKKNFLDAGDFEGANRVQRGDIIELEDGTKRIIEGIDDIAKKMEKLGVESELFDPVKKLIKVFGRRPDAVELYKKAVETGVKKREGGMMSIFDIIQPINA